MSLHIPNCTDIKSSHTDMSTLHCLSIAVLCTIESFEGKYNYIATTCHQAVVITAGREGGFKNPDWTRSTLGKPRDAYFSN